MKTIRIAFQVFNFVTGHYDFASYSELAAIEFSREQNATHDGAPRWQVERCHIVWCEAHQALEAV